MAKNTKICLRCREVRPLSDYYIPKNARTHNNTCRHCRNANITRTRNNDASLRLTLAKLLGLPNALPDVQRGRIVEAVRELKKRKVSRDKN